MSMLLDLKLSAGLVALMICFAIIGNVCDGVNWILCKLK